MQNLIINDDNLKLTIRPNPNINGRHIAELKAYINGTWEILNTTDIGPIEDQRSIRNIAYENAKQALEQRLKLTKTWLLALRRA